MKWIKVRFNYIITAGNYFHLVPHGVLLRVFFKTLGQKIKSAQGLNSTQVCMHEVHFSPSSFGSACASTERMDAVNPCVTMALHCHSLLLILGNTNTQTHTGKCLYNMHISP